MAAEIPFHFRCPISLDLMRDPVIVSTGQTYDRASIQSWLATGNRTCPVTRSPLLDLSLIPNLTLRRLILDFTSTPPSSSLESLVQSLRDDVSSPAAIRALFSLCLFKPEREKAAALRAGEAIVDRLGKLAEREDVERGLATVELLCREERGREGLAAHGGAVAALVKVVAAKGSGRAAEHATGALAALCAVSGEAKREAVERGIVGRLMVMVQGECTERGKRKAQALLKMLREAWPQTLREGSVVVSDDFQVLPAAAASVHLTC